MQKNESKLTLAKYADYFLDIVPEVVANLLLLLF